MNLYNAENKDTTRQDINHNGTPTEKDIIIIPVFNLNTYSLEGLAGQQKVSTQLIIEKTRNLYPLPSQQIQTPVPSGKKNNSYN